MFVLLVLALLEVFITFVFIPRAVMPEYNRGALLRDHTRAQNLAILFAAAERRLPSGAPAVVLIGDSTVGANSYADEETLAGLLQPALNEIDQATPPIQVFEFAALGLGAHEAAVLSAKALAMRTSLIVYGVTPRVVCALATAATDAAHYTLEWDVASLLGLPFLFDAFSLDELATSAIRSHWQLMTFRREVATSIGRNAWHVSPALGRLLTPPLYDSGVTTDVGANDRGTGPAWIWANCPLDEHTNVRLRALRVWMQMCARSHRCLIYHSPINPDGLGSFDPGLPAAFRTLITNLTHEYGVPFEDYSDLLPASSFRAPYLGRTDPIHLSSDGLAELSRYLANSAHRLMAQERAR